MLARAVGVCLVLVTLAGCATPSPPTSGQEFTIEIEDLEDRWDESQRSLKGLTAGDVVVLEGSVDDLDVDDGFTDFEVQDWNVLVPGDFSGHSIGACISIRLTVGNVALRDGRGTWFVEDESGNPSGNDMEVPASAVVLDDSCAEAEPGAGDAPEEEAPREEVQDSQLVPSEPLAWYTAKGSECPAVVGAFSRCAVFLMSNGSLSYEAAARMAGAGREGIPYTGKLRNGVASPAGEPHATPRDSIFPDTVDGQEVGWILQYDLGRIDLLEIQENFGERRVWKIDELTPQPPPGFIHAYARGTYPWGYHLELIYRYSRSASNMTWENMTLDDVEFTLGGKPLPYVASTRIDREPEFSSWCHVGHTPYSPSTSCDAVYDQSTTIDEGGSFYVRFSADDAPGNDGETIRLNLKSWPGRPLWTN